MTYHILFHSFRVSLGGPADHLENKGIVFKARWLVRLDITRARPSFHAKIMVMPVFYQAIQTRRALKTIPLFSFLNIFDLNMQNVTKNDV